MNIFEKLFQIDVSKHIEKKNGLSYLSWPYAWAETKKIFPESLYEVKLFGENELPYVYDENTGYMVFTSITILDEYKLTCDMWLPVMDSANKAMKNHPYTYDTKYKKGITVEAATMFDINKTIMRCLVKNLAMFGLGLCIYAGEDLPECYCSDCGAEFKDLTPKERQAYEEAKKKSKDGKVRCKSCQEKLNKGESEDV